MSRVDILAEEAVRLRDECAVLLREMEERVHRLMSWPRRAREQLRRAERAALAAARRNLPVAGALVFLIAAGAIGGLILGARHRRTRRRLLRS
jgi:hypothetical protein